MVGETFKNEIDFTVGHVLFVCDGLCILHTAVLGFLKAPCTTSTSVQNPRYSCISWIVMSLESSLRNCFVDLKSAEAVLESFSDDIHHHVFQKGPILSASLQGQKSQQRVTISIFPYF